MKQIHSGRTTRRAFIGASAAAIGVGLAGCVGRGFGGDDVVTETVDRSFAAPDVAEVRVANAVGDVTVAAIGTGHVDVGVGKRAPDAAGLADIDVVVDLEAGVLTVETALDGAATWTAGSSPSADVTITVPEGPAGPAVTSIISDVGDVSLFDTRGDAVVRTNLGDVTATGVDGYLSLDSNLGTVIAADVTGLRRVHTDLGDVKVDLLGVRADVDIGTDAGEVVVGVADDLDLDLVVESNAGIDSNLPLSDTRTVGGRFTGRQNAGGRRLHVYSDVGDVSLRSVRRSA